MYTLLFLLIFLCVLAVIRGWPRRQRLLLWAGTLVAALLAFAPHVIDHSYHLAI
ncbi:hypothetical protein I5Q34_33900 [Streptomyces sp. AV19]|uniref:hypothetical protein n=1 Tax=Streptomyces sp. AV19 TaxID=2793068 RepID=UPI0018FE1476|nr:hypothetical protein [Streptomyces sp. AV19]MBH1939196.1 hypothetical protein [Streptomyces sp. AV19]MDG4536926.1 hypothetical protein [Streptomyces sp. AV19]